MLFPLKKQRGDARVVITGTGVVSALGIGWRATASNGTYAFYGAVSYDDGRTFTVHKLSKGDSPTNDPAWVAGDDTSAIWLTHDRFYAVWGDWRGGSLQTWWGGFPLKH